MAQNVVGLAPHLMDHKPWQIERRSDGAVLVRVRSAEVDGRRLPDAVFAFRSGDPQYRYWEAQLSEQEHAGKQPA